jgi:arylsulfatase A-like enzyme
MTAGCNSTSSDIRISQRAASRLIVSTLLSLTACAPGGETGTDGERPNVVFVLIDDARWDDVNEHPFVALPNIDRLAREGASFQNFFTTAPLCSPSRAGFLTGQYAHNNGITDNAERNEQSHTLVTFPRLLHDAGYNTAFVGKWHMGHEDDSPRPGFDRWVSFKGQGTFFDPDINVDGTTAPASGYMTDILNQHAVDFVSAAGEEPFLLYVSHKAIHPDIHPNYVRTFPPAPRHEELYANEQIIRRPNAAAGVSGKPALARPIDHNDPRSPPGGTPDEVIMGRLRMLSAVDDGIGELLAALEASGKLNNTVIVVTSDQGFFYGEFGLAQERRLAYEESIRIPFLIRYPPKVAAGSRPAAMGLNIDVAPTLLELGGAPVPEWMEGRSMVSVLEGNTPSDWRTSFIIEYYTDTVFPRIFRMGYNALRTEQYKYIRYSELEGMDELYDLTTDPHEMHNLLPEQSAGSIFAELRTELDRLLASSASITR